MDKIPNKNTVPIWLIILAAALAFAGGVYLYYATSRADIRKFAGSLASIEGNLITMHGAYVGLKDTVPEELKSARDLSFRVDQNTKMLSVVFEVPWDKILSRNGAAQLDLSKLARRTAPGTLSQLATLNGTGQIIMEADFPSSIIGVEDPVAKSVTYRYMPNPTGFSKE